MEFARGGTTYHDRDIHPSTLQFLRHIHHLLETGCNQSAQADDIHLLLLRLAHDLLSRHHHTHVDDLVIVARHHHTHDVLADIVYIALHSGQQHLSGTLAAFGLLGLDVGLQNLYGLLHGTSGFHHLGQEHLALAKQRANGIHASHQRTFDDIHSVRIFFKCLLQVGFQSVGNAFHQSLFESLLKRQTLFLSPSAGGISRAQCLRLLLLLEQFACELCKRLGSTLLAIQNHILDHLELILRNIGISHLRGWVHDAEVHTLLNGMIEEDGMHGLTDVVVASEREAQITHTTTDVGTRQVFLDPTRSTDEIERIGIVLLHTCGHSQHVGVEDDVQGIHAHLLRKQFIGSLGYLDTTFVAGGLTFFVEAHHHHSSTIALHVASVFQELLLTLFQRDGVDDALALHTLQSCTNHLPIRGVDHHRNLGDIGLGSNHIEEVHHLGFGVEQAIIHIDIYHEGAIGYLLASNTNGLVVTFFFDQAQELARTSNVTSLAHIYELHLRRYLEQLEA